MVVVVEVVVGGGLMVSGMDECWCRHSACLHHACIHAFLPSVLLLLVLVSVLMFLLFETERAGRPGAGQEEVDGRLDPADGEERAAGAP